MLAQNFKTPADLKITDAEFDALRKVLGMLEREEIPYAPGIPHLCAPAPQSPTCRPAPSFFNMSFVTAEHDCGTAGCILGWAQHLAQSSLFVGGKTPALQRLFQMGSNSYEGRLSVRMGDIQPSHAAIALRSYLTIGEPRWAEALSG